MQKTIIITEQQMKHIQDTEIVKEALNEGFFKNLITSDKSDTENIAAIKRAIRIAAKGAISIAVILSAIHQLHLEPKQEQELATYAQYEYNLYDEFNPNNETLSFDEYDARQNKEVRIAALDTYMRKIVKLNGYNPDDLKLSARDMVDSCDKYNFDLPFMVGQAHRESCFGMAPRAQKTNSVFSVGSYDNGQNKCVYSDPNESIVPYIKTIKDNYLVNGKTYSDLLKPNGFVNMNGDRYASDPNYEKNLAINIRNAENYLEI